MRFFLAISLLFAVSAITALPRDAPDGAMMTPPNDLDQGGDMGEGDEPPAEPARPEAFEDPNQTPRAGDDDDDETMLQMPAGGPPSDLPDADDTSDPADNGDHGDSPPNNSSPNLLQVGQVDGADDGADAAAGGADAAAGGADAAAGGADAAAGGADAAAGGADAGGAEAKSSDNPEPAPEQAGGAGGADAAAGTDGPPDGDSGPKPEPSGGADAAPAPSEASAQDKGRGPLGRLQANRPKETADPLYSSGTKINKQNAKLYKKVDYSPAKATERAALTEAQTVINKARSKHIEFLEDTKEEIEKMLDA